MELNLLSLTTSWPGPDCHQRLRSSGSGTERSSANCVKRERTLATPFVASDCLRFMSHTSRSRKGSLHLESIFSWLAGRVHRDNRALPLQAQQRAWVAFFPRRFADVRDHLERCLALHDREQHRSLAFSRSAGQDPGVTLSIFSAWASQATGYPATKAFRRKPRCSQFIATDLSPGRHSRLCSRCRGRSPSVSSLLATDSRMARLRLSFGHSYHKQISVLVSFSKPSRWAGSIC